MSEPREHRIPVGDGELVVAEYGPADGPPVLAIHGITSSSRAWIAVARHLPDVRLLSPDLRGRGRSADLPPSTGLRHHAADLVAVLDRFGIGELPVLGHSMGAFVAVALADARPWAVSSLLLIDGGLPLARPVGVPDADLATAVLGPVATRLETEFPDVDAYRAFWRAHPAFAAAYTPDIEAYADYDLAGEPPHRHPASTPAAIAADALELYGADWYLAALTGLAMPTRFLRAERGLLDEPHGLYAHLDPASSPVPVTEMPGTNHYTILMTDPGAGVVADAVRSAPSPRRPA